MKKDEELLFYGKNICNTIFSNRKQDIIKVYLEESLINQYSNLMKYCANQKKTYHIVKNEELDKICESTHHNGIAILAKIKKIFDFKEFLLKNSKNNYSKPIVYLDNVKNPHNIGIIARTMCHFGVETLITNNVKKINSAMARMSEGGIEYIDIYFCDSFDKIYDFSRKNGYKIVSTSSHSKNSVYNCKFENKTIFIFGDEVEGVSKNVMKKSDELILIPGTNKIESLNVSVACGIILSEYYRVCKN